MLQDVAIYGCLSWARNGPSMCSIRGQITDVEMNVGADLIIVNGSVPERTISTLNYVSPMQFEKHGLVAQAKQASA